MKLAEMNDICKKQNGICKNCPLNCIYDWEEKKTTWCLAVLKTMYTRMYKDEIKKGNEKLANEIMEKYIKEEQKYLKRNGESKV